MKGGGWWLFSAALQKVGGERGGEGAKVHGVHLWWRRGEGRGLSTAAAVVAVVRKGGHQLRVTGHRWLLQRKILKGRKVVRPFFYITQVTKSQDDVFLLIGYR